MVMIPMECPKCGRRGSVPSNRLNTAFHCRNCQAPFYLNANGDVLPGEPPVPRNSGQGGTAVKEKKKAGTTEIEFNLAEKWREMTPKDRNRLMLTGAGVALVLVGVMYYLNSGTSDPLTAQSLYAARAFADDDLSTLKSMAAEGTSEQLVKWFNEARTLAGLKGSSSKYSVSAGITSGGAKQGSAGVTATFLSLAIPEISADSKVDPRAAAFKSDASTAAASPITSVDFRFLLERGYWRLDGKTMLEDIENQKRQQSTKAARGK